MSWPRPRRSGVSIVLVVGVNHPLQLERRVLDGHRKMLGDTLPQLVNDRRRVPVVETLVIDNHVGRERGAR